MMPVCFLNDNLAREEPGCRGLLGWGDIQCQLLLLTGASPRLGKITFKNLGGGEAGASAAAPNTGVPILPSDLMDARTPELPGPPPRREPSCPPTHQAQAQDLHKDCQAHPHGAGPSCSRLPLADLHLSVAFPRCRPLTTGAIFVSLRCSLKPFKNGEGAGEGGREGGTGRGERERASQAPAPR